MPYNDHQNYIGSWRRFILNKGVQARIISCNDHSFFGFLFLRPRTGEASLSSSSDSILARLSCWLSFFLVGVSTFFGVVSNILSVFEGLWNSALGYFRLVWISIQNSSYEKNQKTFLGYGFRQRGWFSNSVILFVFFFPFFWSWLRRRLLEKVHQTRLLKLWFCFFRTHISKFYFQISLFSILRATKWNIRLANQPAENWWLIEIVTH